MKSSWKLLGLLAIPVLLILVMGTVLAQSPFTVTLNPQNNSGESGTAVLTDMGDGTTQVVVNVQGEPAGGDQPMHIHNGTCDNLDPAPVYPLNNLVNGQSTTVVTATLGTLMASPFAINGHKSAQEANNYVFCGEISSTAQMTATTTVSGTAEATGAATTGATAEATGAATTGATAAATEMTTTAATAAATETATTGATTEATGAATTGATAEATVAATTAATAGTTETPAAQPTTVTQLPTTGGTPNDMLIPIVVLGVLVLGLGLVLRRATR